LLKRKRKRIWKPRSQLKSKMKIKLTTRNKCQLLYLKSKIQSHFQSLNRSNSRSHRVLRVPRMNKKWRS